MTPAPGLGFSRDKNTVTLRMTVDDWEGLLILLGQGLGSELSNQSIAAAAGFADRPFQAALALLNRINEGNPNWTPYREAQAEQVAP